MGLMKAGKQEIVYIELTYGNEGFVCEKSFSELSSMIENDILPVLFTDSGYLYPYMYIPSDGIVFSCIYSLNVGLEIKTLLIDSENVITDMTAIKQYNAIFSHTEGGYTCNREWSDFYMNHHNITNFCVKYKGESAVYITLLFGGVGYDSGGLKALYYYYDDCLNNKRIIFSINSDNIVTMTEKSI